ncbi:hypothetical protein KKG41_06395 [Patescibacteria group bacterium]|nr:hypothetical protein [Patescibacteria group bacterium]MBU1890214.1 hypothetical protein [Patescibacteria group bacterium]
MSNGENTKHSQDDKLFGALSYLWVLSVVMYVIKKDNEYVKFHARQGLVLFIASVIIWFIPFFNWLLNIVVLIIVIIGFVKAIAGERWEIPVVGPIAKKINF